MQEGLSAFLGKSDHSSLPGGSVLRLVLLNTVINGLEERLSNEVTVYAENHRIRVPETKAGCSCRRFSQYLVEGT